MNYAVSDLHGYPVEKFKEQLADAGFSDADTLFVLGDVIDRGNDGVKLLQWMRQQSNGRSVLGNHEQMMLKCAFLFERNNGTFSMEQRRIWSEWRASGGSLTLDALYDLPSSERRELFDYVRSFPLFREVNCNGMEYLLTHSGISHFHPDKPLTAYHSDDFLWHRPKIYNRYYDDKTVIFGHTPTAVFDSAYEGKPYITETWIDIDAGTASGYSPLLIRLEDRNIFPKSQNNKGV